MKENKITKSWVIKAIVIAIATCCVAIAAWFGWIYDIPSKIKHRFLRIVNREN